MALRRGFPRDIDSGVGVISVGVCGGLDPGLRRGDLVIPEEVATPGGTVHRCDVELTSRLLEAAVRLGVTVRGGRLVTTAGLVGGAERAALAAAGGVAVDMETALLAGPGRGLAAVRAVLDTAEAEIDPAFARVWPALVRPWLWPQALRMSRAVPRLTAVASGVVADALRAPDPGRPSGRAGAR